MAETGSEDTLLVMPPVYATAQALLTGDRVEQELPTARADKDDVARLQLTAGETGDTLAIEGTEYRILSIEPERNGFCTLELGAV